MKHVDDFFKQLTLIDFEGGAMGTFLCCLLGDNNHKFYNQMKSANTAGMFPNFEWQRVDYFGELVDKDFSNAINFYSKKYVHDWEKNFLYSIAVEFITHMKQFERPPLDMHLLAVDHLKRNLATRIETEDIMITAIKGHSNEPTGKIFTAQNIPWRHKIHAYFPADKFWIQQVLLFWKKYLFPMFDATMNAEVVTQGITKAEMLLADTSPDAFDKFRCDSEAVEDYKHVNMYELIFYKNTDTLYDAIPGLSLTNEQHKLLDLAHTTSMEILKKLGMDHTSEYSLTAEFAGCLQDLIKKGPEGPLE